MDNYFKTRDVTLNEVLLRPNSLIFTRRAYRDMVNKKVNAKKINIDSRLGSRILLFACRYGYKISNVVNFNGNYSFDFLVCLLKAYELNIEYKYYDICKEYQIIEQTINYSEWLIKLLTDVYSFNLYGREKLIAKDILNNDKDILDELYSNYPELKKEVDKLDFKSDVLFYYKNVLKKKNGKKIFYND